MSESTHGFKFFGAGTIHPETAFVPQITSKCRLLSLPTMVFIIIILLLPVGFRASPTIRKDPSEIPPTAISGGNCRLRFNEINVYPSGAQQFVELIRICETDPPRVFETSMDDTKKRSLYKVTFISHDGYLIGVCDLVGKTKSRHGFHIFTIGGEHYTKGQTTDMNIEDCNFASDYAHTSSSKRFPVGDAAPIGLGLVYNQSPTVLTAISLDRLGTGFKKVAIDTALKKKIMQNLQDFLVYTSSSPYTHCKYFADFYSNYNPGAEGLYMVRDWAMTDDQFDYSRSRCAAAAALQTEVWLPFKPKEYLYAPASPNAPNKCEKSVRFVVEETQAKRPTPREDFDGMHSCFITTVDRAIEALGTITHPISYGKQLQAVVQEKLTQVSQAVQAVLPATAPCDVNDEEEGSSTGLSPFFNTGTCEEATATPQTFKVDPISQDVFEQQLEQTGPHVWSSCERFQPQDLIKLFQCQANPDIYPHDILNPNVCSWFEYILPVRKFRCKFCNKLLTQGLIPESKGSKLVTLIMTTGQGYCGKIWAKTMNSKLINDHTSNIIHTIAEDYYKLFDSGLRGAELQSAFEREDGPLRRHMQATENTFKNVFQCIRLDIPFEKYAISAETLRHFEVDIGFLYINPSGYKLILMSISRTIHEDLLFRLLKERPVLSVMIDTSTDISSQSTLAIVFHIFGQKGEVEVALYRIIKVTAGESAQALFDLFTTSLKEDGLEDYVKERCIGFSSDGGPNVIKFRKMFSSYTKHNLASIHCMNHRLELSIKKAWKEIPELKQIEEIVNMVYGLFHRSAKKKIILAEAAEEADQKDFELKRIIKTRWMATRARAINSIFDHWKPIVTALSEIQKDRSFEVDQRVKASVLYEMLLDPYILSTLAFTADVCEVIASVSVELQKRGSSVIGKKEKREVLQDTLTRMINENGPRLETVLKTAKITDPEQLETEDSLLKFEEHSVNYEGIDLISTGDMYFSKLSAKRKEYLQPIVDQIDAYYPEDMTDRFDILDPTRWAQQTLEEFGNSDLQELNIALLWNFEEVSLKEGWKNLKSSVYSHKEFQERKKVRPRTFGSTIYWIPPLHGQRT